MKNLLTLLLVLGTIPMHAQKIVSLQLGPLHSAMGNTHADLGKTIGYFVGIGLKEKITDVLSVDGSVSYQHQRHPFGDRSFAAHSINALFGVNLHTSENLYFIVGPEVGHSIAFRMDGELYRQNKDVRFAAVGGIGFRISDKATVFGRYHHAIDGQGSGFDYNVQVGVSLAILRQ